MSIYCVFELKLPSGAELDFYLLQSHFPRGHVAVYDYVRCVSRWLSQAFPFPAAVKFDAHWPTFYTNTNAAATDSATSQENAGKTAVQRQLTLTGHPQQNTHTLIITCSNSKTRSLFSVAWHAWSTKPPEKTSRKLWPPQLHHTRSQQRNESLTKPLLKLKTKVTLSFVIKVCKQNMWLPTTTCICLLTETAEMTENRSSTTTSMEETFKMEKLTILIF